MKKIYFLILASAALSFTSLFSHSHDRVYVVQDPEPSVMLIQEEPPANRVEVIPTAPNSSMCWMPGCWRWENRWVWSEGYWTPRPYASAAWVPGMWVKHHHRHGWYWTEGHWR